MELEDHPQAKLRLIAGMSGMLALILGVAFFAIGFKSQKAVAPTKYINYVAADKAFACVLPDGWRRTETTSGGIASSVRAEFARARVSVRSDLSGSLMADITRAQDAQMQGISDALPGGMQMPQAAPRPPVEKLHIAFKQTMEETWDELEETEMATIPSPLGEARLTEWTGRKRDVAGAGTMHGLRVTILSGERRVNVLCYCPERDWKTLRPAFSKVVKSLAPGGA